MDTADPLGKGRIRLKVHQILGDSITNWADACLPVTSDTTHANHTDASTSGPASSGASHTHSVVLNSAHDAHNTVPNLLQVVWVMFIGGNPNHPVWLGVAL